MPESTVSRAQRATGTTTVAKRRPYLGGWQGPEGGPIPAGPDATNGRDYVLAHCGSCATVAILMRTAVNEHVEELVMEKKEEVRQEHLMLREERAAGCICPIPSSKPDDPAIEDFWHNAECPLNHQNYVRRPARV